MIYAGFWRRLGALLVDSAIFLPLTLLDFFVFRQSRTLFVLSTLLLTLVGWTYQVWMHARWGQTLGKMATGVRVVALDGSPISWRQAFLRSSVTVGLGCLSAVSSIYGLLQIPQADYPRMSFLEFGQRLGEKQLWPWLTWVQNIWLWSEVIVMLFNERKRSIHDFIARTVVVRTNAA